MLKTLHSYLTRDLLKVTLLSLVAITLLMTVLAIIQPLRKMGLAGTQVLQLFAYTLPVMLSFTLPVATLFAATLVYGRFSQDNELLACRVSGVATTALLRPALVLGGLVTVISLVLSNLVAPALTTVAGQAQAQARGFVYHSLRTRGYLDWGRMGSKQIVHADVVDADANTLFGVTYAYVREPKPPKAAGLPPRPGGVVIVAATLAFLEFPRDGAGEGHVVIAPYDPSVIRVGESVVPPWAASIGTGPFAFPLENPISEKPSWFSITKLWKTLEQPQLHAEISRKLEQIRQSICSDMLAEQVVSALRDGQPYAKLTQGDETYQLQAPRAHKSDDGVAVLTSASPTGRDVEVTIFRGGVAVEKIAARAGRVSLSWSPMTRRPQVALRLEEDVQVEFLGDAAPRPHHTSDWSRGELAVPADIRRRAEKIDLADLYARPEQFTRTPAILREINYLRNDRIPNLTDALIAELHARIAYGVSCFLMVAMGAALGLIFRGGQFISAFAISAVPAAIVIAMLLMGKGMVRNPDVHAAYGLACIWGGIAALALANVLLYWRLARR